MKYSIVIPTFNRAKKLGDAINSVLAQTFQNFEILVIDDGSIDDTNRVVSDFDDGRITYIFQNNGGGSKARNTGINAAKGDYIAFLDSDDVFLPHHLHNALKVLESGASICTYAQVYVDRGGGVNFIKPPRGIGRNEHISEYLMCDRGFIPTSSLIVPSCVARNVLYDETLRYGQDTDFAIRLVNYGCQISMLDEPSVIVVDHASVNRVSSRRSPRGRIDWLARIRCMITNRAYHADMGWVVAKAFFASGLKVKALYLYFHAVARGCYSLKMCIVVFLQIVLNDRRYRQFSDRIAKFGVRP